MNHLKMDPIEERLVVDGAAAEMILADLEAYNLTGDLAANLEKLIAKYQARLDWFDSLDFPENASRLEPYVLQEVIEDLRRVKGAK